MNHLDWNLFDRYMAGQASPEERAELEKWLSEDPERGTSLAFLRGALTSLDLGVSSQELDAIWEKCSQRAGIAREATPAAKPIVGRDRTASPRLASWPTIAAAVILIALGTLLVVRHFVTGSSARVDLADNRIISVPNGARAQFELPDGSGVLLGAGSTLRWSRASYVRSRDVRLTGEAYFTVVHDKRNPFRVHAMDLVATDLGTEFLVQAYPEQPGAQVVVRSGTVAVQPGIASGSSVPRRVVRPGELGRITAEGQPLVEQADTALHFAWIQGVLVLDRVPLRQALPRLSRWYDLEFRLADTSLGSLPLSGRLDRSLTPSRLDLLAGSVGLRQVSAGRVVTLYRIGDSTR